MLYDAKGYEKIYIAPGYTDMRKSIDGLKLIIVRDLKLNPYQKNVLFLFCGRNSSKIKALVHLPRTGETGCNTVTSMVRVLCTM